MPVHFGSRNDSMGEIVAQVVPVERVIPVEMKAAAAIEFMDWKERLRTTEDYLQKLSHGYPFPSES